MNIHVQGFGQTYFPLFLGQYWEVEWFSHVIGVYLVFKVPPDCFHNDDILNPVAACELQEPWFLIGIWSAQWSCASV